MSHKSVAIASDHAGFALKKAIIPVIERLGYSVTDFGPQSQESVDYPDFGARVARSVQAAESDMGVLICGTGIGISITANRFKGVRAALCYDEETARLTREHNNANILALGGRTIDFDKAIRIIRVFFTTPYEPVERHQRRIEKIDQMSTEMKKEDHA